MTSGKFCHFVNGGSAMREIRRRWEAWRQLPFPEGLAGEEVNGICLTSLDTFAAGCIDTFLERRGSLDAERIAVLRRCAGELRAVVPALAYEAAVYFGELSAIADLVLSHLRGG
jgi:hypothetical protein